MNLKHFKFRLKVAWQMLSKDYFIVYAVNDGFVNGKQASDLKTLLPGCVKYKPIVMDCIDMLKRDYLKQNEK